MIHLKALLFGDDETAAEVLRCGHPRAAKGLGRKVKNFDEKIVSSIHTFTYIYIYIYIYTCDGAVAGHVRSRFDEQWVANRERIVFEGNYAKFTRLVVVLLLLWSGGGHWRWRAGRGEPVRSDLGDRAGRGPSWR